jgi:non-heme chloroperoxidase
MDLRGHGYSEKPRFGYDHSQNWANDIQAVIQSLDLIRPILIGWSYGGPIVCDYLRHYGEDFISGVHFVDAGTLAGTKEANRFFSPERHMIHKGFISNDAETCSKSLADFVRLLFYKPPSVEDYYFILGYNTIVPPYVRQEMSRRIIENDRLLSQMRKPVLITHGMEDRVIFYTLALRNAQFISHARTSFYSQTGHSPFWENPDRFNSELRYFVMEAYR